MRPAALKFIRFMGVRLLDSKYEDFQHVLRGNILGNRSPIAYAKGNELPHVPPFSGNVGFTYQVPTSSGDFNAAARLSHSYKVLYIGSVTTIIIRPASS